MKSQDILILLKLISLDQALRNSLDTAHAPVPSDWSARGLSALVGVSKTEVNTSLNRSIDSGLAIVSAKDGLPRTNTNALLEFIVYGIKYVFPVRPAEIVRGIPTAFAAPIFKNKLMGGDIVPVWPDQESNEMGQSIMPLYHSVPTAIKKDATLYALLALVDAIRIGGPRERKSAAQLLKQHIRDVL